MKPKHTAEYRQWILVSMQQLVDHWDLSMLYALGTKPND
jgi:hypothetical protein